MDVISDMELNEKIERIKRLSDFAILLKTQNETLKQKIEELHSESSGDNDE